MTKHCCAGLAAAAALGAASMAPATEIYLDEASFQAQLQPGFYLEAFNTSANQNLGECYTWTGGDGYGYTACAPGDELYLWDSAYSGMASDNCGTNGPNSAVNFTFDPPMTAFGGYMFLTDINFDPIPGGILDITLNDGTTITLNDPYDTAFVGFTSVNPIVTCTLTPSHSSGQNVYITFDHVYAGTSLGGGACPEDINGDGMIDVLDLLAVIAAWGNLSGPEDINGDGIVDVLDLLAVIGAWGPCSSAPVGACCLPDETCEDLTFIDCWMAGGDWYEGEECATFTCPELPTGACCIGDECVETNLEYYCDLMGGNWFEGETCPEFDCILVFCDASGGCDEYISNVECGTIFNPTDCDGYGDHTILFTYMHPEQTYSCTVTNGNPVYPTDQFGCWVDWNHDGNFDGPDETVVASIPGVGPYTFDITVPADAFIGDVRMRVRITYATTPQPCGQDTYGEVEDYTLRITP